MRRPPSSRIAAPASGRAIRSQAFDSTALSAVVATTGSAARYA
ncbi:hypothetical protein [Nocardiopsis prasina]|nr:hypothetical protein [Nocardiopsis prasina]